MATEPNDEMIVKAMLAQFVFDHELLQSFSWDGMEDYWAVVEDHEGLPIACCLVTSGQPIARIDYIATDKSLTGSKRSRAIKFMVKKVSETLRDLGAQAVSMSVPGGENATKRALRKSGAVPLMDGATYIERLV